MHLRWVTTPHELRASDLVILPGSKATIPDLLWLHQRRIGERVRWLATYGTPVLGICAGYQMLGNSVRDLDRVESEHVCAAGLQLLPIETELGGAKRLARVHGHGHEVARGIWSALSGVRVAGDEIHVGRTSTLSPGVTPLFDLDAGQDGSVSDDGLVAGSYLHGILEQPDIRRAVLHAIAFTRGFSWAPAQPSDIDPYDRLATVLGDDLQVERTCVAPFLVAGGRS